MRLPEASATKSAMEGGGEQEYPFEFSAVISCHFEERSLREFHARLARALDGIGRPFEIVYVNDGSTDGTLGILREIYGVDDRVGVLIDLIKNSGSAAAVAAGCAAARGRHFIFMDSDLQLEPEELPVLVGEFEKGADLVNGFRLDRRDPWPRKLASRVVNAALRRMSGSPLLDLGCTFKVARGELVRGLAPGPHRVMNPVHLAAAARDSVNVPVRHHPRPFGRSGWGFATLLSLTVDTLLGLSHHPFEVLSVANLLLATVVVLRIVFAGLFESGSIFPAFTQGLVLNAVILSMAVIVGVVCLVGEYVLRLHRSAEGPPRYIVRSLWRRPIAIAEGPRGGVS